MSMEAESSSRDLLNRFAGISTDQPAPELSSELSLGLSLGGCFSSNPREKTNLLIRSSSISAYPNHFFNSGIVNSIVKEEAMNIHVVPERGPNVGQLKRASSLPVVGADEEYKKRKVLQTSGGAHTYYLFVMASQTFHVRFISLPSKSQQEAIRIEEEIKALKSIVASPSGATIEGLKNSLREIGNIYERIKVTLQLPSNQGVSFNNLNKKWMEKELDESIKILDLCTNIRDYLVLVKDHAQEISSALSRKDKLLESRVKDYG